MKGPARDRIACPTQDSGTCSGPISKNTELHVFKKNFPEHDSGTCSGPISHKHNNCKNLPARHRIVGRVRGHFEQTQNLTFFPVSIGCGAFLWFQFAAVLSLVSDFCASPTAAQPHSLTASEQLPRDTIAGRVRGS